MSLLNSFLSRFDSNLQTAIVEFGKRLTKEATIPNTVFILMARKAVCFFDCLEYLNLVVHDCPVISDRVLDMNAEWLLGKRIIIIDDALISGTSLYKTKEKLLRVGINESNIHIIVLCVNTKWWRPKLIQPEPPYLELDQNDTASLCASIVEAISIIPRPYEVDFPLFTKLRIPENQTDMLFSMPGWDVSDITTPLQLNEGVISRTLTPDNKLLFELDQSLGWNFSLHGIIKIRLYGKLINTGRKVWMFKIMPVVILNPLQKDIVENLFNQFCEYQTNIEEIHHIFCAEHLVGDEREKSEISAKFRLLCYIVGSRIVNIWCRQLSRDYSRKITLQQDEKNLLYLFSPNFIHFAQEMSENQRVIFISDEIGNVENNQRNYFEKINNNLDHNPNELSILNKLYKKFIRLYETKELKARQLVVDKGIEVFKCRAYKKTIDRLNTGYSLLEISKSVEKNNQSEYSNKFVSYFLDQAIDRGCVVPITCYKENMIYRAYRHGEDVVFGEEEERLCSIMLKSLADAAGMKVLSRTIVEKSLVLFIKTGLEIGILNKWRGHLGEINSIGIRYSLFGAVVGARSPKLYFNSDTLTLTSILERSNYIKQDSNKGFWQVQDVSTEGYHENRAHDAKSIGILLGSLIGDGINKSIGINEKEFTILATLQNPKEAIGALAAQIDIANRDLFVNQTYFNRKYSQEIDNTILKNNIDRIRKSRFHLAAHNGMWKFREYEDGTPWHILNKITDGLKEPMYKEQWEKYWPKNNNQKIELVPQELIRLLKNEAIWLCRLKALCEMSKLALLYVVRSNENKPILDKDFKEVNTCLNEIYEHFSELIELQTNIILFRDKIFDKSISIEKFGQWQKSQLKELHSTAVDLLSEVDLIASTYGNPKGISRFEHVLHISVAASTTSPNNAIKICENLFREIRSQARKEPNAGNYPTLLVEIPQDQTAIHFGIWICSSGAMSRSWLIRLACNIFSRLHSSNNIQCLLFPNLPEKYQFKKTEQTFEYNGVNFWEETNQLYPLIYSTKYPSLKCIFLDSHVDTQGIRSEITTQLGGVQNILSNSSNVQISKTDQRNIAFDEYFIKKEGLKMVHRTRDSRWDVGILTVLPEEIQGIRSILKLNNYYQEAIYKNSSGRFYDEGIMAAKGGGSHKIVCTRTLNQGNNSIVNAYQELYQVYNPSLMILLGIAGGISSDVSLCDVVIANKVFNYEDRAVTEKGIFHRGESYSFEPWLQIQINEFFNKQGGKLRLKANLGSISDQYTVHLGPIGSGEAIVKDSNAEIINYLKNVNEKVLAVDKESLGTAIAWNEDKLKNGIHAKGYLIIRGISDLADKNKDDNWRIPATQNSMSALQSFLELIPEGFFEDLLFV